MKNKRSIESLKASVMADCKNGDNCFSENGCTKERCKCSHDYCGKYKWILDRASHYAEKSGKPVDEILEIWETSRNYWYMNYYQGSNQPLLNSEEIVNYDDWISDLNTKFGKDPKKWSFKCPHCGESQTAQDFIDNGIEEPENKVYFSCIGRYVEGRGCDWTLGGLLSIHKKAVFKDGEVFPVFETSDLA